MDEMWTRIGQDLIDRVSGPMNFRLLLQPMMAAIFAVRDGLDDARRGEPPYFWALFTGARDRWTLLRSGFRSVGKVFLLALLLDAVYQFIVARFFWPGEAAIVAILLAIGPYVTLRGLVGRWARD